MWHAMYIVTVMKKVRELDEEGQIVIVKQCIYGFIASAIDLSMFVD